MNNLLKEFRPLDLMVLSTVILGNQRSAKWLEASNEIIDFIGNSFGFDQEMKTKALQIITNDLDGVATLNDVNYNYANPNLEVDEMTSYFNDIKFRNILMLQDKYDNNVYHWTNYQYYHQFHPYIHYQRISKTAKRGDLIACRHTAILEVLGIGTQTNYDNAILRLQQAIFWGDITSAYLLREVYRITKNEDKASLMDDVVTLLEKYLNVGVTIVDKENEFSESAKTLYVLISSTYHDIVKHQKELIIDYSFVEVMLIDELSYHKKLEYITNYQQNQWKDESNSTTSPQAKFGFIKRG